MERIKESYPLNGESLPTIPVPHDCVIKRITLRDQCLEFVFEDHIANHDSIQYYKPDAKSLILRYHLTDEDDFSIYRWSKPRRPFQKDGKFKRLENRELLSLPTGKYKLEYLYHNVAYCSIITKLYANGYVILDVCADSVELEWIC